MTSDNLRLQPWRYLFEVARGLGSLGYEVTFLSDDGRGQERESLEGMPMVCQSSVRVFPLQCNSSLETVLEGIAPDCVLLSVGLTSFIHQDFHVWRRWPTVGIFTSPLYTLRQLVQLGFDRLWQNRSLSAIHLLGALVPRSLLRWRMQGSGLRGLVVQTYTMRCQLRDSNLWQDGIEVIPPGVDPAWGTVRPEEAERERRKLGYGSSDVVVAYFGSPAPLRGLPLLIQAVERARRDLPAVKLLVLSRRRPGELGHEAAELRRSLSSNGRDRYVRLVNGYLSVEELARHVAACDIAALPFELVPSDAPLSLLEVKALGMPLVTTHLACLPELAEGGRRYLAQPGDPASLAVALMKAVGDLQRNNLRSPTPARPWRAVAQGWAKLLETI